MNEKLHLENVGKEKFHFLTEMGFDAPKKVSDSWSSTLCFLNASVDLSIELHFDWRDMVLSVLIVRLKNGKEPEGYYVSEAKRCRVYLQELVRKNNWLVPKKNWERIQPGNDSKKRRTTSLSDFEEGIEDYREVLKSCVQDIVSGGESLFE